MHADMCHQENGAKLKEGLTTAFGPAFLFSLDVCLWSLHLQLCPLYRVCVRVLVSISYFLGSAAKQRQLLVFFDVFLSYFFPFFFAHCCCDAVSFHVIYISLHVCFSVLIVHSPEGVCFTPCFC